MTEIILDEQQAQIFASAPGKVRILNRKGETLGEAQKILFTPEEIAEAKKRFGSPGPWSTTAEVLARLEARAKE